MTAAEWCQISGKSPDPREQSRYDASARLSVAPMMDWTDTLLIRGIQRAWYTIGTVR